MICNLVGRVMHGVRLLAYKLLVNKAVYMSPCMQNMRTVFNGRINFSVEIQELIYKCIQRTMWITIYYHQNNIFIKICRELQDKMFKGNCIFRNSKLSNQKTAIYKCYNTTTFVLTNLVINV